MNEQQLQAQCFQWFWNTYPEHRQMLYHNNNNSVNSISGNKMKALGVVKGVSDFTFIDVEQVVFIEMKTEEGRLKPEQIDFRDKVTARGHLYFVIRTFEAFVKLMKQLIQ